MRIVLDTNILISSMIQSRGPSALLVDAWLDGVFELVTSALQLVEFRDVVERPRLRKWVTLEDANELYNLIRSEAVIVPKLPMIDLSPDPDDNLIIAAAIEGQADAIVTGDKADLLALGDAAGIPIITARQALERLARQG